MEHDDGAGAPTRADQLRSQQVDNAIRAIQNKKPLPEIDFTIHTMEDGTQVSTQERVCKGMVQPVRRCQSTPRLPILPSDASRKGAPRPTGSFVDVC
jgi:hypothetical protein